VTLSKRIAGWIFGNLWLKVLSLGLAMLLWMVVSGEETVERGLRVPLELTQVPADLEVLEVLGLGVEADAHHLTSAEAVG